MVFCERGLVAVNLHYHPVKNAVTIGRLGSHFSLYAHRQSDLPAAPPPPPFGSGMIAMPRVVR
jgi:hypothetical protein